MSTAPDRSPSRSQGDGTPTSGPLRRLGARAIGQGWAVRSDASLPFALDRFAEPAPLAAAAAAHASSAPSDHRAPAPSFPRASEHPPSAGPLPEPDSGLADHRADRSHPTAPAEPPPVPVLVPLRVRPSMPAPHRPAALEDDPSSPVLPQDARAAALAPQPPALLPLRDTTVNGRPALAAGRASPAFSPPVADPAQATSTPHGETEVHIHIGRIEVTALQEAPRPKARPRERAQPMSLDAYLDQRRKAP